jgi:hypothetical protein
MSLAAGCCATASEAVDLRLGYVLPRRVPVDTSHRNGLVLVPRPLTSEDVRLTFTPGVGASRACFERELLDRYRPVFERR